MLFFGENSPSAPPDFCQPAKQGQDRLLDAQCMSNNYKNNL